MRKTPFAGTLDVSPDITAFPVISVTEISGSKFVVVIGSFQKYMYFKALIRPVEISYCLF